MTKLIREPVGKHGAHFVILFVLTSTRCFTTFYVSIPSTLDHVYKVSVLSSPYQGHHFVPRASRKCLAAVS